MSNKDADRVVCISNEGYPASLNINETYTVLADDEGEKHGLIRVIDESGGDYLYPESCFQPAGLAEDDNGQVELVQPPIIRQTQDERL